MKGLLLVIFLSAQGALAAQNYELTLTNGTNMPISPGVVYVIEGQKGVSEVGDIPTPGLVTLCQMGNPALRLTDVQGNKNVSFSAVTPSGILPGKSIVVPVSVANANLESVHFEAMYGESKESCAWVRVGSRDLNGAETLGRDQVISAGAAQEPAITSSTDLLHICDTAPAAIDCLRNLTSARTSPAQIHNFSGYLPSVLNFLEVKYGPEDVLTLFIPQSGGLNYSLQKK